MVSCRAAWMVCLAGLMLTLAGCSDNSAELRLKVSPQQLTRVAQKIFQNECAGRIECLVHWNQGEAFPSLGIGHFIWYPAGVDGRFVESFPQLIAYMRDQSVTLPEWLADLRPFDAPWPDRQTFMAARDSDRVHSLRDFLQRTRSVQASFLFERAQDSLTRVVAAAPEDQRHRVRQRIIALSATPNGVYALMDYVNFKGEGLSPRETYQGKGWGLLQVLLAMREQAGEPAIDQFQAAAERVLTRRARLAPNPIERKQWLAGWLARIETYH